ncbi:uncharacterized protein LACBIDRAFT_335605 [Laccaria bicolor S238N-H82]|uniref:Predicted protein n=1 Tax=Laccaria bicolor (strain S238N-H82 / ATCC MYA-4686) TaxID=486041 RepID=B0E2U0_LACBS|nr:uncharacterized protein LACBIDRAFT_335605 [Laccaria bicolor S238N-H82]EDQ98842.1 predicted protein [Laccaria bicolor S238N-H82]|eukprot:XP_001890513.1 predicted protein [Laccaria bicolor S238N-H82]
MTSFPDIPPEIVKEIIDALQEDLTSLKACSQTCQSLLPLCRQHIFRTISLTRHHAGGHRSRMLKSLRLLLDSNADIAHYVRNLVYEIEHNDEGDDNVRVLEKLHPVQTLELNGSNAHWNTLRSPMQEALLRLIHSHSLIRARIYFFWDFPVTAFIPCVTLTDLAINSIGLTAATKCDKDEEYTTLDLVPHIRSFTFGCADDPFVTKLFHVKRSSNVPMLDFRDLKELNIHARFKGYFEGRKTLLQASEKLEILHYRVTYLDDGCKDLFAWMNKSSLSTLKRLHIVLGIKPKFKDPLCGLCDELTQFAGRNVIEEITLNVFTWTDQQCTTDRTKWGRLDTVLADGFPMLRRVSLHIDIKISSCRYLMRIKIELPLSSMGSDLLCLNSMWHSFRNVGVFARPTTNWDRWPSSCRVFEKTGDTHSVIIQVRLVFLDRIGDLVPLTFTKNGDPGTVTGLSGYWDIFGQYEQSPAYPLNPFSTMLSAVSSQFHVERPSDVHALPAGTILLHPSYSTGHTQLPWLTPSLHLAIDLQLVVKRCVKRSDDDDWPLYEGVNLCFETKFQNAPLSDFVYLWSLR